MSQDDQELKRELKKSEARVIQLFETYPRILESPKPYAEMDFAFLKEELQLPFLDRETYSKLMEALKKIETMHRMARKLWEAGLYMPTNHDFLYKRGKRRESFRRVMPKTVAGQTSL